MKKPAIFAAVILIALVFMNLLNFSIFGYTNDDGWYVTDESVTTFMQDGEVRTVELTYVDALEPIYERLGSLFVTEEKLTLDTSYPMFVGQEANGLYFSNDSMALITSAFGSLPTYNGLYLSAGATYNADGTRADGDEFILTYMPDNGFYMTAQNIIVNTVYGEKSVPMNSVVEFTSDSILYMSFEDGSLQGNKISAMNQATITIGTTTYDYYNFLIQLGILEEKLQNQGNQEVKEDEIAAWEQFLAKKEAAKAEAEAEASAELGSEMVEGTLLDGESDDWLSEDQWKYETEDEDDDDWYAEDEWMYSTEDVEDAVEITVGSDAEEEADSEEPAEEEEPADDSESSASGDSGGFDWGSDSSWGSEDGDDFDWGSSGGSSSGNSTADPSDPVYTMPTVTLGKDFSAWVYTIDGSITIDDPSYRMSSGVTLYLYTTTSSGAEQLSMRQVVYSSGDFTLSGVAPNTTYTIKAVYSYYDNNNTKQTEELVYEGSVTTLDTDALVAFTPWLDNSDEARESEVYSEKFVIHDLQFAEAVAAAEEAAREEAALKELEDQENADDEANGDSDGEVDDESVVDGDESDADDASGIVASTSSTEVTTDEDDGEYVYSAVDTIQFVGRGSIAISKVGSDVSVTRTLSSSQLSSMRNGNVVDFTTSAEFDTNSEYTYEITYYDSYSNVLPLTTEGVIVTEDGIEKSTEVSGLARTSKETPSATIWVNSTSVADVQLTVVLKNADEVEMENVVLRILDSTGAVVAVTGTNNGSSVISQENWVLGDGDGVAGTYTMTMTNLNASETYTAQVYCDSYDVLDNIVYEAQIITSVSLYTRSIATLGYVDFATTFSDYSSSGVTATSNMYATVNTTLKALLTRAEVQITKDNIDYAKISFSKEDLDNMIEDLSYNIIEPTYNEETGLWSLELPTTGTYYDDNGEQIDVKLYLTATTEDVLVMDPWAAFLSSSNASTTTPSLVTVVTGLDSNTQYNFAVNAYAQQASGPETDVSSLLKWQNFTTWKETPTVYISNQFTSGNFHEIFDFVVYDKDGAIANSQSGGVTLAIFKDGSIVQSTTISATDIMDFDEAKEAGAVYDSYRFSSLVEGATYTLRFIAQEYNVGEGRLYGEYIYEVDFTTGTGITGEISLNSVDKVYNVGGTNITWSELNIWPDIVANADIREDSLDNSSGVAYSSTYDTYYGIPVTAGDTYIYSGGQGYTFRVTFFNASGTFVSGSYLSLSDYGNTFTVPDGAATMSIGVYSGSRFYVHGTLMKYDSTLTANSTDIYVDETADAAIENYYLNTSGTAYTSSESNIYVTDYIPIDKGGIYELSGFGTATPVNTVVYYDAYKRFIKYQYTQGNELLVAPETASYMRMENYTIYPDTTIKKYASMDAGNLSAKLDVHVLDQLNSLIEYMDPTMYTVQLSYTDLDNADNDATYEAYKDSITGEIFECTGTVEDDDGNVSDYIYREVWDTIEFGTLPRDYAWKAELTLYIFGSEILLDDVKFTTAASIKTISCEEELLEIAIDPSANYVVINDFTTESRAYTGGGFSGTLDLQGYTITYENQFYYPLFETVENSGTIKNGTIDFDSYAGSYFTSSGGAAVVRYNYGTLENIAVDISVDYGELPFAGVTAGGVAYYNYSTGVIQNFTVYYETEMKVSTGFGGVVQQNWGLVQNGWVGGEQLHAVNYTYSDGKDYLSLNYDTENRLACIVRENDGIVRNIFTMNDLCYDTGTYINNAWYDPGMLVWYNAATVEDCYAVGDVYRYDPNSTNPDTVYVYETVTQLIQYYAGGRDVSEVWQVERSVDLAANNTYEKAANSEILYDVYWQDSVINGDDQFSISDLISLNYYPQVYLGSYMEGKQRYIPLPNDSANGLDIISTLVIDQNYEKAEAIITVENPNKFTITNIEIEGIDTVTITEQGVEEDKYRVYVTLEDPTSYVSVYEITEMTNLTSSGLSSNTTYYGSDMMYGEKVVYAEFYRPISNVDEWNMYVTEFLSGENFHLTADIDFSEGVQSFDYDVFVDGNFAGKLDGGVYNDYGYLTHMYTLKNINNYSSTNGGVFHQVSGTIRNVIVENYESGYGATGSGANLSYVGFIRYLYTGATVENVHIVDSKLGGAEYIGGIAAYSNYSYIEYCSSSNLTIEYIKDSGAETLEAGGIVGRSYASTIKSCYSQDFYMKTDYVESCGGVGGIAGTSPAGDGGFLSCWTNGTIDVLAKNLGGIVGRQKDTGAYVRNSWSMMNIFTVGDGIGGIVGTGYSPISNSIALGNLVSRSTEVSTLNRLGQGTVTNGYGYELQLLNGVVSTELNGAINLLSVADLSSSETWNSQIQIGSNYSLTGDADIFLGSYGEVTPSVASGYLPMLVYEDGRGVYGQEPIQLLEAELDIEVIYAEITNIDNYAFTVHLDVTSDGVLAVDTYSVTMEGANATYEVKEFSDASEYEKRLEITGYLTNAWDSYLVDVVALDENGNAIGSLTEKVTFETGPVYKDIPSSGVWYTYLFNGRENTFENLRITGDLDFTVEGLELVFGVSLNRLEGYDVEDSTRKMNFGGIASKDLTYSTTSSDARFSLIQTVVSSMKNMNFQYIDMDTTATDAAKTGLIGSTYGNISNVAFNDLDLHFGTGDVVGTIGYMGSVVENVTLENINVTSDSGSYVGGFAGYLDETSTQLTNVVMNGTKTYDGSGDEDDPENYTYSNNIVTNATSGSYYGGLFGYMTTQTASWSRDFEYMEVHGTYVKGKNYVGGICGLQHHYMDFWYTTVTDSYIHGVRGDTSSGGYYVGGISGYLGHMYNYYPTVTNTDVVADIYYAGAITGYNHNYERIAYGLSSGNNVSAGIAYAGGLTGYYGEMYDNIVEDCTVWVGFNTDHATNSIYGFYAGGITGHSPYTCRDNAVVSTSVSGKQYIGGIAGSLMTDSYDRNYSNTVVKSTITGEEQVGGLYGETIASVFGGTVLDCTITGDVNVGGAVGRGYATDMYTMGVNENTTVTGDTNVGGLIGYSVYYTTKTSDYLVNLSDSYSAATVEGDEYVGGLIGLYEPGASMIASEWPTYGDSGSYVGTPTANFPVSYTGLLFMGSVTGTGDYVSLWGNGVDTEDEIGLNATRIYAGSTRNNTLASAYAETSEELATSTTPDTVSTSGVVNYGTSSGLSIGTTQQLNQQSFYENEIADGGMNWTMNGTVGRYMSGTVSTLYGADLAVYRTGTEDIYIQTTETGLSGTYDVTFTNGGADLIDEYVQDDLILWLDAKNNSGFGSYDATTLTWVNLANYDESTGYDTDYNGILYYNGSPVTSYTGSNHWKWIGDGLYNENNSSYGYVRVPSLYGELTDPTNYTVQFVYDYLGSSTYYLPLMAEVTDTTEAFTAARGTYSRLFYVGGDSYMGTPYTPDDEYMLTYSTERISGTQYKYAYSNGATFPTDYSSSSSWDGEFMEYDLQVGNGNWRTSGMVISAVRVYDGILTADELEQNAITDAALYGPNATGIYEASVTVPVTFSSGNATIKYEDYVAAFGTEAVEVLEGYVNVTISQGSDDNATTYLSESLFVEAVGSTLGLTDATGKPIDNLDTYTETPYVTVSGGTAPYTWYRSTTPNTSGGEAVEELSEAEGRYLDGRGYYYCVDSTGAYSPLVFVNTQNYMFYNAVYTTTNGLYNAVGTEGLSGRNEEDKDELNDHTDKWYSGGTKLPLPELEYPTEVATTSSLLMRSFEMIVPDPPEAEVYASSEKTLNIEFDSTIPYNDATYAGTSYFQVYKDDVLVAEEYIDNRVYSFTYDFVSDLTILVSNGSITDEYEVLAEDMQRTVMTYGDDYYYISPDGVSNSSGSYAGQFVHLMNGYGITTTGGIYDVKNGTLVNKLDGTQLLVEALPVFTTDYSGVEVKSYGGFSDFGGSVQEMGFVAIDDIGYSIPGDGTVIYDGLIADTYGSEMYFGMVTSDGDFGDVTGNIVLPEEFTTYNVDHMTNTVNSDTHYVLVRYESNKVAGFDYVTGELLDLTQPDDINYGVVDFFNDFVASLTTTTTSMIFASDYVEAVELQSAIESADGMAEILNDGTIYGDDTFDDDSESGLGDETIITEDTEADGDAGGVTDEVGEGVVLSEDEVVDGDGDGDGDTDAEDGDEDADGDGDGDNDEATTGVSNGTGDEIIDTDQESKEDSGSQSSKEETEELLEETEDAESAEDVAEGEANEAEETATSKNGTTEAERKASADSSERYIVAYNAESGSYELYRTADLIEGVDHIISETQKVEELQKTGTLPEFTLGTVAQGQQNRDTGLDIFTVVVVAIGGLLVFLVVRFTTRRKRKRKRTFADRIGKDE